MCQKIKPYLSYILAGALGVLTFIFSAFSGVVTIMEAFSATWRSSDSVYGFMNFTAGAGAWNSAGVFEIFLIIISVALITFAVLGVLNKLGKIKISLGKLSMTDLLMYITFGYVVFAFAQSVSVGVFIGQNSSFFTDSFYATIGAGPLLMLFASAGLVAYQVLTKWVLKDKSKTEKQPVTTVVEGQLSMDEKSIIEKKEISDEKINSELKK